MSFVRPTFQPQNPAVSDCPRGWSWCTPFSAAMAASFDRQVKKVVSGCAVGNKTGDTVGGTTLAQVTTAVRALTGVEFDVYYGLPWDSFVAKLTAGRYAILQGLYAPIADSRFDAGHGFRANHAIGVPPDVHVQDPLADGRYASVYKYVNEAYPLSLLRTFAGKLDLDPSGTYRPLGLDKAYVAFTKDRVSTYQLRFDGGERFFVYNLTPTGQISTANPRDVHRAFSEDTGAQCSVPIFYRWSGHNGKYLVRMLSGGLRGEYVDPYQGATHLVEYP